MPGVLPGGLMLAKGFPAFARELGIWGTGQVAVCQMLTIALLSLRFSHRNLRHDERTMLGPEFIEVPL